LDRRQYLYKLLEAPQSELGKALLNHEFVMRAIARKNAADVRFASVYRSFEDIDEFAEVVREVRPAAKRRKV